jgi:3-phosphoshikimate 1-carboxyvinyltransferase
MPGDKSISHRAAMIAALATGTSRVSNFANSADCAATLSCLKKLGVVIEADGSNLLVHGVGIGGLREPGEPLDCANSGTTMRLLAGILAGQKFTSTLTGDASLRSRPMQRIIEPLQLMGARISSHDGCAPLTISGSPLTAIKYKLLVASAQVKSCILLAALQAEGKSEITEEFRTRDHTERMLTWFDVDCDVSLMQSGSSVISVGGQERLPARDITVPGDISSAAYFLVAAALLPDSSIEIKEVGLNPTRAVYLWQLRDVGLKLYSSTARHQCNEIVGTIQAQSSTLERSTKSVPTVLSRLLVPQLIDELPLLAVVGSQIEGGIEIRDAAELRAKESDRIAATASNLRAMGADVEEFTDGLRVAGPTPLRGALIDPRGDHRIAMAFSVAGLIARGETEIKDADCVAVSFPEFFELLESVVER